MSAKKFTGKIVSNKMTNAVVVAVEMPKRHPIYSKIIKNTRRFKATTDADFKIGDMVVIEECRPVSSTISWKVTEKLVDQKDK